MTLSRPHTPITDMNTCEPGLKKGEMALGLLLDMFWAPSRVCGASGKYFLLSPV